MLLKDLAASSSFFAAISTWFNRGVGRRAIWAAKAAAEDTGGRPAASSPAAAWEDTRPGGKPEI